MSGGIQWNLLSDLGKNFANAYNTAQDNETQRQRLALLNQHEQLRLGIELRKQLVEENAQRQRDALANIVMGGAGGGSPNMPLAPSFTGGGQSMTMPTGPAADIENRFLSTVKGVGLTNPVGLAAVGAYGARESGYNPANINRAWSDPSESGQAGTSGGALSWRNDRLQNLYKFASGRGEQPGNISPETQALFFSQEDPTLLPRLQAARSPEEANQIMAGAWKFAGYNQPGGENAARLNATRAYLERLGGGGGGAPIERAAGQVAASDGQTPAQVLTGQQAARDSASMRPIPGSPVLPANPDDRQTRALVGMLLRDKSTFAAGTQLWKELRSGEKYQVIDTPQGKAFVDPRQPYAQPIVIPNTAPDAKADPKIEAAGKLRGEFDKHQVVKDFQEAHNGYERVIASVKAREANPQAVSPAADIGLVYGYMKMLDPGSVVRETEYATAENARGVPDHVRGLFNRLLSGERLTPEQRQDFTAQALDQYQAARRKVEGLAKRYRVLAGRQGLDPEDIVYLPETTSPPQPGPKPQAGAADSGGGWADMGGGYRIREKR